MIKGARPSFSLHSQAGASFTFHYWWGLGHLLVKGEKKKKRKGEKKNRGKEEKGKRKREENEKRTKGEEKRKRRNVKKKKRGKKETLGKEKVPICLVGIESPEPLPKWRSCSQVGRDSPNNRSPFFRSITIQCIRGV